MGSDRGWGPSGTASSSAVEGCWVEVEVLVVVDVFVEVWGGGLVVVDILVDVWGWVVWWFWF